MRASRSDNGDALKLRSCNYASACQWVTTSARTHMAAIFRAHNDALVAEFR